ncbi:MAG TPA: hypothetical protein VKT53_04945 [Candidatus Acidoferrum sp.]|nr:hypothetical protein [Candidatus Acidoferrum sp.]
MSEVSDKIINVSKTYLGPATESFLSRQCTAHLKVELASLTAAQVKTLAERVEKSAALIMDAAKAAELAKKIAAI